MPDRLSVVINEACAGLPNASAELVLAETKRNLYDGITDTELALAPIMAARTLVEPDPDYSLRQRTAAAGQAARRGLRRARRRTRR